MKHSGLLSRFCILICMAGLLGSCTIDDHNNGSSKMKLKRLDITGAQSLALMGRAANSKSSDVINQLFKIDQDGNLTAVMLEVLHEEDGTETTTRTDISVHPREVCNLSNAFTYFYDCRFFDGDGNEISMRQYYEPDALYFNILVQNSTGRIFYIPEAAKQYFFDNSCAIDKNGNLFVKSMDRGIAQIVFNDGTAKLVPYGPAEFGSDGDMYVLDNGTLAFLLTTDNNEHMECVHFLYPNGGFEYLDGVISNDYSQSGIKDGFFFNISEGKLVAVRRPKDNFERDTNKGNYLNKEVSIELVDIEVGTSYGNIRVSAPWAEISGTNDKECNEYDDMFQEVSDWTDFARRTVWNALYNCQPTKCRRYWFIGNILAYEHATDRWIDLVEKGLSDKLILPHSDNVYKNKVWRTHSNAADWFDTETLEYGRVGFKFDSDALNYRVLYEINDIPHGKIKCNVISPVDGKKYIISIDIETGEYTQTEQANQDLDIIELIPMN